MLNKWKEIQGFEGLYKISNEGKIYSNKINAIMKTYINNNGYECVQLTKNKKRKHFLVHRLVAGAFCSGYQDNLVVNHIDGNRLNNRSSNLEWCTTKENILDMKLRGTMNVSKAQKVAKIKNQKPVKLITPEGEELIYPSIKSACMDHGLSTSKGTLVAKGTRNHTKGFKFIYITDDDIV